MYLRIQQLFKLVHPIETNVIKGYKKGDLIGTNVVKGAKKVYLFHQQLFDRYQNLVNLKGANVIKVPKKGDPKGTNVVKGAKCTCSTSNYSIDTKNYCILKGPMLLKYQRKGTL